MERSHETEHSGPSREPRRRDEASIHRDKDDSESDLNSLVDSQVIPHFEEKDLCSRLVNERDDYRSPQSPRAVQQLLGRLIRIHPENVAQEITNLLKFSRTGPHGVSEFTAAGRKTSEKFANSAAELWTLLKKRDVIYRTAQTLPPRKSAQKKARRSMTYGRLLQIRTLPPIVVLQLLVCLDIDFDKDRLFSCFMDQELYHGYHPRPNLDFGPGMLSFTMTYYYLAHEASRPSRDRTSAYSGQTTGLFHEDRSGLRLCRGSSSIAVRFEVIKEMTEHPAGTPLAPLFLMFAPWEVLILSCNARAKAEVPGFRNGIEAYLWAICHELAGIRENLQEVTDQISSVAVPSDEILFDSKRRESLLFEDKSYSNSRTCFWALQSLRILNECITSLVTSWRRYKESNTPELIAQFSELHVGISKEARNKKVKKRNRSRIYAQERSRKESSHPIPVVSDSEDQYSSSSEEGQGRSNRYIDAIDLEIRRLEELVRENNAKQEELKALRDGLFNASAVLEARASVTQGQNIRILTVVSMIFLPAAFVTSIFGMQSILPTSTSMHTFSIVMTSVCVPTYLVILALVVAGRIEMPSSKGRNELSGASGEMRDGNMGSNNWERRRSSQRKRTQENDIELGDTRTG